MINFEAMDKAEKEKFIALVLSYPSSLNHYDIIDLIELKVPPDYAHMFKGSLPRDLIVGYHLGISPQQVHAEMSGICDWSGPYHEVMGMGVSAVVLRLRDEKGECSSPVMKIGKGLSNEYRIWEMVADSPIFLHPSYVHSRNLDVLSHDTSGCTIDNQLNRLLAGLPTQLFYPEHIFHDVFEQLDELRLRGIFYADLRPQNVLMVDRVENRLRFNVLNSFPKADHYRLLDFGESSDDPSHIPTCNRRYGGSDLMSLGQLLYKCTSWDENLFNDYSVSSLESADQIRENRISFCNDPKVREKYLSKVDRTIEREEIAGLIKVCLLAGTSLGENPLACPKEIRDAAYDEVRRLCTDLRR